MNILLTTAKCLQVIWFSNSLPNPNLLYLYLPQVSLAILLYAIFYVFCSDWLNAIDWIVLYFITTVLLLTVITSTDHGTYSSVIRFLVYSTNYFCTTWYILDLALLFSRCLSCSVETIWFLLSFHNLKMSCPALIFSLLSNQPCTVLFYRCSTLTQPYSFLLTLVNCDL